MLAAQFQARGFIADADLDVRPTDIAPALARDHVRGRYEMLKTSWGFPGRQLQINARSDTLHEKMRFREAFRCRRCLIPASAFYEFSDTDRFLVSMGDGSVMALAGLFDSRLVDGRSALTSTVITTEPNSLIAPIHPRMPVILRREDWEAWLDPTFSDVGILRAMMQPYPAEGMVMVNNGKKASAKRKHEGQLSLLDS